jgi:hypothetical protein
MFTPPSLKKGLTDTTMGYKDKEYYGRSRDEPRMVGIQPSTTFQMVWAFLIRIVIGSAPDACPEGNSRIGVNSLFRAFHLSLPR